MSESSFSGWVDRVDEQIISGWAANTAQPDTAVNVSLYIDGAIVTTVACNQSRQDAVAAGHPGARAFSIEWRQFMRPEQSTIEIGFERTNFLVPNGKRSISSGNDEKTGRHWSKQYSQTSQLITRWWESEYIVRAINKRVCGEDIDGPSAGMHRLALQRFQEKTPFSRGVSIGAGTGSKERLAIQCGLVDHFTLFELSQVAVDRGREEAAGAGLAERMDFRMENGMESETHAGMYDFVYWNNALHHMFDVKAALEWSRRVLKKGGVFLMDDFVGPDRMQWSDQLLAINSDVRRAIDPKYLRDPRNHALQLPVIVARPDPHAIIGTDPSECVDSARILPEILRIFPDAEVIKTGGGIYHLGMNDIMHNILADGNFGLIDRLMDIDDQCAELGETHYAVVMATVTD